jgi:thiamine-phosphate pyrophosphorylase
MQRQTWPTAWLMTDERIGYALERAIAKAAAFNAGVIVRHYQSTATERARIADRVHFEGALLGIARDIGLARDTGAALVHNPGERHCELPFSISVHDAGEATEAAESKAALVFVSPVFPTASHPGAAALGEANAISLALMTGRPAYALGGVDQERGERLMQQGWAGWAGIDAWL